MSDDYVLLLDGAQGTELERHGADLTVGELWSSRLVLDDPELIKKVHRDYLEAGSDVITTLTYQATLEGFQKAGLGPEKAVEGFTKAVNIAAEARKEFLQNLGGPDAKRVKAVQSVFSPFASAKPALEVPVRWPLIAFSAGSYGGVLADGSEFTGNYAVDLTEQELLDFHKRRLDVVKGNPEIDILAFETVPCLKEALAIAELLSQSDYKKLAWISFSCKDGQHTCHGEDFAEECIPALWKCDHIFAIGVNCTAPLHVSSLLKSGKAKMDDLSKGGNAPRPLLLTYPNNGETFSGEDRCWHSNADDASEPQKFATLAEQWVKECGLGLVGGCCRTTPDHIRNLKARLAA